MDKPIKDYIKMQVIIFICGLIMGKYLGTWIGFVAFAAAVILGFKAYMMNAGLVKC